MLWLKLVIVSTVSNFPESHQCITVLLLFYDWNLIKVLRGFTPFVCLFDLELVFGRFNKVYRHTLIYAVNVGTHKKTQNQKPRKSRLLKSTKGEKNRIEL